MGESRDDYDIADESSVRSDEIEQLLEETQKNERGRIKAEIETIEEELEVRDRLHGELVNELERELERYKENLQKLVRLYGSEKRKQRQKKRIRGLSRELREERQQHWHDRQRLLDQRRELHREFSELEDDFLSRLL